MPRVSEGMESLCTHLRLTRDLIVGELIRLVRCLKSGKTEQVDVPLIYILLQLSDLQAWLDAECLNTGDNFERALPSVQQWCRGIVRLERRQGQRCDEWHKMHEYRGPYYPRQRAPEPHIVR